MEHDTILPRARESFINYIWLAEKLGFEVGYHDGELSTRCPFHDDNSPSFSLNLETGMWCCYVGCGGGKFVDLVMRLKGISWREAKQWIIEQNRPPAPDEVQNLLLKRLKPIVQDTSSEVYYETLDAKTLPRWFFNRHLTWETADRWGIRWDQERQRLVIPIRDSNGKWIGYVARNLNPDLPKYINSPGLKAGQLLFGWNLTRNSTAILVEGPLDALWLDQNNIPGVIALLGTNLSTEQIRLLQVAQVRDLIIAMDNDEAGKRALYGYTNEEGRSKLGHLTRLFAAGWNPSTVRLVDTYTGSAKDFGECPASDLPLILQAARTLTEKEINHYVWRQ